MLYVPTPYPRRVWEREGARALFPFSRFSTGDPMDAGAGARGGTGLGTYLSVAAAPAGPSRVVRQGKEGLVVRCLPTVAAAAAAAATSYPRQICTEEFFICLLPYLTLPYIRYTSSYMKMQPARHLLNPPRYLLTRSSKDM